MTWIITQKATLSASRVLAEDLPLPSKPAPTIAGQTVIWVDLLDLEKPGFWYEGKFFAVTGADLDRLVRQHQEMTAEGYEVPHLVEHKRNGENRGTVRQLVKWSDPRRGGRPTLIAAVQLSDDDAPDKLRRGEIRYFSPGLGDVEDSRTKRVWRDVINEVSRVSAPHRKTGNTHVLGAENNTGDGTVDTNGTGQGTDNQPSTEDRISAMEQRMGAVETTMGEIKSLMEKQMAEAKKPEGDKPEGEGAAPTTPALSEAQRVMMAEVDALKKRAEKLEEERDKARFDAGFSALKGKTLTLSENTAPALYRLSKTDPEAFNQIVGAASEAKREGGGGAGQGADGGNGAGDGNKPYDPWGNIAMGEGGGADETDVKLTPAQVVQQAKAAGIPVEDYHAQLVAQGKV